MSTNRLNADERASFLIGEALRKAMVTEKHSAALHELFWAAYVRAVDAELTPDERVHVMVNTGFVASSWCVVPEADGPDIDAETAKFEAEELDDDIPF